MRRSKYSTLMVFLIASAMTTAAMPLHATTIVVQTFDELNFQPIDGLTYNGVSFSYQLNGTPSDDAKYGSFGPVITNHVSDPSVIGNSQGILAMDFEIPTEIVEFGVALSDTGPVSPGFTVDLFDATGGQIETRSVDTEPAPQATGFSDALFQYSGVAINRVVVDFADDPGSFALDNLTYAVPEPSSGIGLCGLVLLVLRRRSVVSA